MSVSVPIHSLVCLKWCGASLPPEIRWVAVCVLLVLINSAEYTCVIRTRQFSSHTHICRGNHTSKHVVHGRDSPSSHACSYQQGSLMMSHFNDVTASDLWLAPIPCLSGCAGGYIDCRGVNACMVRLAVILCWSAVVISEIKILSFTETSHTFSVALGLCLLWQFAKGDKTDATCYRRVC